MEIAVSVVILVLWAIYEMVNKSWRKSSFHSRGRPPSAGPMNNERWQTIQVGAAGTCTVVKELGHECRVTVAGRQLKPARLSRTVFVKSRFTVSRAWWSITSACTLVVPSGCVVQRFHASENV